MTPGKKRLYEKRGRYYGDFRDFADVGGKLEALIPPGARPRRATSDPSIAMRLLSARLEELEALAQRAGAGEVSPGLRAYATYHLKAKARSVRASTVARDELSLRHVVEFHERRCGSDARLEDVTVETLTAYLAEREREAGSRTGSTIAAQTMRHELTATSSLFKRAIAEGKALHNPAALLPDKPRIERDEPTYLEVHEAARLIAAAAALDDRTKTRATPYLGAIVAAFLYTGGRKLEVLGLEVDDIDFANGVLHFRPNAWRRLKRGHRRTVRLWPRLERILRTHLEATDRTVGLVFPSSRGRMLRDLRDSLGRAVEAAGIAKHVTLVTLRHTFGATRIQTLDHGAPVHPFTVARELGHSSLAMIERHYGHLLEVRHRAPVVEYVDNLFPIEAARRA